MEEGGTLAGLREAQRQGLCEFIGVTGRAIPLLARLAATGEFDPVLCYHDYHPCVQLAAEAVLPAASVVAMPCRCYWCARTLSRNHSRPVGSDIHIESRC